MATLYISASGDPSSRAWTRRLVEHLERGGYSVFWPTMDLDAGDAWEERLASELDAADAVLFVIDNSTPHSEWARFELTQEPERVLPILPDGPVDLSALPLLRSRVPLDMREERGLERVDAALAKWGLDGQGIEARYLSALVLKRVKAARSLKLTLEGAGPQGARRFTCILAENG